MSKRSCSIGRSAALFIPLTQQRRARHWKSSAESADSWAREPLPCKDASYQQLAWTAIPRLRACCTRLCARRSPARSMSSHRPVQRACTNPSAATKQSAFRIDSDAGLGGSVRLHPRGPGTAWPQSEVIGCERTRKWSYGTARLQPQCGHTNGGFRSAGRRMVGKNAGHV
jgi:hypothetical protein